MPKHKLCLQCGTVSAPVLYTKGSVLNRAHPLVLGSRAGIALQHLATQECLLRLFEVRSGECDSNRQSRRQEIPQDAAADCTFFPKPEQEG
jgi:hypothetical protein